MAYIERQTVAVTTDADGDGTGYTEVVTGRVLSVQYAKTDYAAGVDFTITTETTAQNIWVDTDVNASETVNPRVPLHDTSGAAVTFDGTNEIYGPLAISRERVKIVVAQGGDTKTGTFYITIG